MPTPEPLRSTARPTAAAPAPSRLAPIAIVAAVALIVGLGLGIAIGRGPSPAAPVAAPVAAAPAPASIGQLVVSSQPTDGNVTIDGRFVGVTPVDRLDLDPGKHSIVIDAFGYQPYAGTLAIEAHGKVNLKVLLVPIGGTGTTSGKLTGPGKATAASVPATALAPAAAPADKPADKPAAKPARPRRVEASDAGDPPAPRYEPPPRPRRDCSGEKYQCRDVCSRAETDCRFSCPTCSSCLSSMGSEECRRQCDVCRSGCQQNVKFCESTCDGQYNSCQASQ